MKRRLLFFSVALLVAGLLFLLFAVNKRPYASLPPIAHEYYECEKCSSLDGGIYGKGPTRTFRTIGGQFCIHTWNEIERRQFKRLASERFSVDWSKEPFFWSKK